jgi:hypothetical protein
VVVVEHGSQSSDQLGVPAVGALEALEFLEDADGRLPFHAGGLVGAEHGDGAAESLQFVRVDRFAHLRTVANKCSIMLPTGTRHSNGLIVEIAIHRDY